MRTPVPSTIAQVLFETTETVSFAHIVHELEQVFERHRVDKLEISWDCDDLVFFDLDETRLALAYSVFPDAAIQSCLTISVGPRWEAQHLEEDPGFDVLCSRIVERLQSRYMPIAILWDQTDEAVSADLLDTMVDELPAPASLLPPIDGLIDPLMQTVGDTEAAHPVKPSVRHTERPREETLTKLAEPVQRPVRDRVRGLARVRRLKPARPAPAANDMSAAAAAKGPELDRMREALYGEAPAEAPGADAAPEKLTTPMRLAVHAMNATLIFVWMPLGAAAVTYTIMKGEDMRVSGRLMAVTGTFLAYAHSPIFHSVARAVAGTLH